MTYRPLLLFIVFALAACTGGTATSVSDEQLRGLGLQVDGVSVLHDDPDGPTFHIAPPSPVGFIGGSLFDLTVTGPNVFWSAELLGAEPFVILVDSLGALDGIACFTETPGTYDAQLTFTSSDQPGRAFRAYLRCEIDPRVRTVPVLGASVGDDGVVHGVHLGDDGYLLATFDSDAGDLSTWALSDPNFIRPGLVDGVGYLTAAGILWAFDADGPRQLGPITASSAYAFDGGAFFIDSFDQVQKSFGLFSIPVGTPLFGNELQWVSTDGRYALASSGTAPSTLRDLTVYDSVEESAEPFTRPDGTPWFPDFGIVGIEVSDDLSTLWVPTSAFVDAHLWELDVATGDQVDHLERALAHVRPFTEDANAINLSAWDITPDHAYATVVFDSVRASPGGFRQIYSAVYVIELATDKTWLASVDATGARISFEGGGFDGRTLDVVALSPGAERVLFGGDYISDRSVWVEVP